ncbi:rCG37929 [Rattus norvegicus]|uniref:RCG37929 n=1 Tax=Rattus norvegicus TaxID=10116 RepID=A6K601_RAT|nr:rCG37929 [Rattus norvegicus]
MVMGSSEVGTELTSVWSWRPWRATGRTGRSMSPGDGSMVRR